VGEGVSGGALSLFFAAATIGDDCLDGYAKRGDRNGSLGCGGDQSSRSLYCCCWGRCVSLNF